MTVSVRGLLAMPEWNDVVRVLTGADGLVQPVGLVRPAMSLGDIHSVAAGELVAVANPVSLADWRIDALLRRVADAGGAGILLHAEGEPLHATSLLGDRLGVPLLATTAAPLDLLLTARLALAAPDVDRAELVLATHRALGVELRSPEQIAGILGELLRAPAALLDDRGESLTGAFTAAAALRVDEPVPQHLALPDGVLLAHPALLPGAARPTLWLVTELRGITAERAQVIRPALEVAAAAAQRWLLANRAEAERDAGARAALLGDLLRLADTPTGDLRRRAAEVGWQLGGWHIGIRVDTQSAMDHMARGPEVIKALRANDIDAVLVAYGEGWTAWTTFDQEPTAPRVRGLANRLRTAQHRLRHTMGTHMGVGRPYCGPSGLAATVADASDAARLATTRPEQGHFLHADQLGMAQLLLEWTRTDTFEPAARALLAPLRGQPGNLVRTLAAYLDTESSLTETAAVLGVHRNTIAARIARIQRGLGVDLTDRDERLALHLACRTVLLAEE